MRRGERVKLWEEQKTLEESFCLLSILCKNWGVPGQFMSSGDRAAPLWANSLGWNDLFLPVLRLDFHYFLWTWILSNHNWVVKQPFKSPNVNNMCYFPPFWYVWMSKVGKTWCFSQKTSTQPNVIHTRADMVHGFASDPPGGSENCGDAGMKAAGQTCDHVLNPWLLGLTDEGSEPISQAEEAWRG